MSETRLVQVRQHVLKQNDVAARSLRARFRQAGTYVVSLVSSPGAGKTALLEKVLGLLRADYRVAALVGDLATDNDARGLARSGAPVKQITTGTVCHLEAAMVAAALDGWDVAGLDFLFLENVGNLVCPATLYLGENLRLVLFSVTEGEDKPLKYPTIFNTADVALITKVDLAEAAEFDAASARRNIQAVRPGMPVFDVSAKTGRGLQEWTGFLRARLPAARQQPIPGQPGAGRQELSRNLLDHRPTAVTMGKLGRANVARRAKARGRLALTSRPRGGFSGRRWSSV